MKIIPQQRIAITGIGMVTPLGQNSESSWQALLNRHSGINTISKFDASGFPAQIAAEVKNFAIDQYFRDKKLLKQSAEHNHFAIAAALEAITDAGIAPNLQNNERWGLVVGCGMMSTPFDYWDKFRKIYAPDGQINTDKIGHAAREFFTVTDFAKTQANTGLGLLAKIFNICGYTNSVHTACASSGQALGLALQVMRRGEADHMLVGGFDSMINPIGLSSFCLLGALATDNDQPQRASRPFDHTRNGFVLGEGAAFLVLETLEKARMRAAKIYAELAGEGNSLSAYRITDSHPSGDGAIQALKAALKHAAVTIETVDYINAHGTSTKMNDLCETNAIKAVFGPKAYTIPISSTKSQTGHLIAAAGAVEAAFTALSIYHSKIPMTLNLTTPDPECDLDYVADMPRDKTIRVAISNSFGFGGSNSCIVLRHPEFESGGQ